jgi:uncharacterized protein YoxC
MEQILAFVLGVSAVAFVWVVVVVFKTKQLAEQNTTSIKNIEEWVLRNEELLGRRIDQEIDRTNRMYEDCIRYTDSRVDKLDAKFCSDGKALTEKSKKFLKG